MSGSLLFQPRLHVFSDVVPGSRNPGLGKMKQSWGDSLGDKAFAAQSWRPEFESLRSHVKPDGLVHSCNPSVSVVRWEAEKGDPQKTPG